MNCEYFTHRSVLIFAKKVSTWEFLSKILCLKKQLFIKKVHHKLSSQSCNLQQECVKL